MKNLDLFPLDVESSIYGMTTFDGKILVATSDCKIYCLSFNKYKPQLREIEFAYIPNGAKIIFISALERNPNDFVIGITHSKNTIYYFNVYSSGPSQANLDLEHIAQGCQTIRLRYVPYHLFPTECTINDGRAIKCWLLSGSDNRIHIFAEDKNSQSYEEKLIQDYFPELDAAFDCPALWIDVMDIQTADINRRLIALGFEDGTVRLLHSVLDRETNSYKIVKNDKFEDYTTIVPCVRLFRIDSTPQFNRLRSRLKDLNIISDELKHSSSDQCVNLLIVSSTHPCIVFNDVLNQGLESKQELPESQRLDCNTSATIGDINLDGRNEILIGNHGKELITYQYNVSSQKYVLDHVQLFNNPVYSLAVLDITCDILYDVSVLLSNGILLMKSSVRDALEVCRRRVDGILSKIN